MAPSLGRVTRFLAGVAWIAAAGCDPGSSRSSPAKSSLPEASSLSSTPTSPPGVRVTLAAGAAGPFRTADPAGERAASDLVGAKLPGLAPLAPSDRRTLLAGPEDPSIEVRTHYIQSNETRHDLYFPYIRDVGHAYVGVGSDQNYTLAAQARSSLMFLLDIDTRVVDLHRMYEVFIRISETPRDLIAHWSPQAAANSRELLTRALADRPPEEVERIVLGYRAGRETIFRHLQRVVRRRRRGAATTWLSDPDMYAHIRSLYRAGRVRIMVGNLQGEHALASIATASRQLDAVVGVLYLSNAEEYFKYTPRFTRNVRALPVGPAAMVLRTIFSETWEHADLWAYQVQPLDDFRRRLADRRNRSRNPMLRYAAEQAAVETNLGTEGLSRLGFTAEPWTGATPPPGVPEIRAAGLTTRPESGPFGR